MNSLIANKKNIEIADKILESRTFQGFDDWGEIIRPYKEWPDEDLMVILARICSVITKEMTELNYKEALLRFMNELNKPLCELIALCDDIDNKDNCALFTPEDVDYQFVSSTMIPVLDNIAEGNTPIEQIPVNLLKKCYHLLMTSVFSKW